MFNSCGQSAQRRQIVELRRIARCNASQANLLCELAEVLAMPDWSIWIDSLKRLVVAAARFLPHSAANPPPSDGCL